MSKATGNEENPLAGWFQPFLPPSSPAKWKHSLALWGCMTRAEEMAKH